MSLHTIISHGMIYQSEILDNNGRVVGVVLPAVREMLLAQGMTEKLEVKEDNPKAA